jgi:hypothetical protein
MAAVDDITELGHRLAAEFPQAAQHRGWTVRNLNHNFEQTPWGVEETWSCEVIGPRDLWTERHRFAGATEPRTAFTWRIAAGIMGTTESTTADGLVEQVQAIVEALGIKALREPS